MIISKEIATILIVLGILALLPLAWLGLQMILYVFIKMTYPIYEFIDNLSKGRNDDKRD